MCSICLARSTTDVLLDCGHRFHEACLAPWLPRIPSCPNCREPVGANWRPERWVAPFAEPESKRHWHPDEHERYSFYCMPDDSHYRAAWREAAAAIARAGAPLYPIPATPSERQLDSMRRQADQIARDWQQYRGFLNGQYQAHDSLADVRSPGRETQAPGASFAALYPSSPGIAFRDSAVVHTPRRTGTYFYMRPLGGDVVIADAAAPTERDVFDYVAAMSRPPVKLTPVPKPRAEPRAKKVYRRR